METDEIRKNIIRLAEINMSDELIGIGVDNREEKKKVIKFLTKNKAIEADPDEHGGFNFIGRKKKEYTDLYLDHYVNF